MDKSAQNGGLCVCVCVEGGGGGCGASISANLIYFIEVLYNASDLPFGQSKITIYIA